MTPKSFDISTAKEWVGDADVRTIEAKALLDAETNTFDPPNLQAATYAGKVSCTMRDVVYAAAFEKRKARILRIKEKAPNEPPA